MSCCPGVLSICGRPTIPVYLRFAAEAAEMRPGGVPFETIVEHFGVDDHTAANAVRWLQQRAAGAQSLLLAE